MVNFSSRSLPRAGRCTLRDNVTSALAGQARILDQRQLRIELEFDSSVAEISGGSSFAQALTSLLHGIASHCDVGSELQISVCRTMRGLECEIIDADSHLETPLTNAFTRCDFRQLKCLHGLGGRRDGLLSIASRYDIYCSRCPQGGVAWTLVDRPTASLQRAA